MQSTGAHRHPAQAIIGRLPLLYGAIRFEHTVFALPFAYIGMVLAAGGWPGLSTFIWITVAMTGARTIAMASNRLVHRKEDAANPRTAGRHLPQGLLKPWEMAMLIAVSAVIFFVAAWQLNTLALALAPAAAVYVVLYSFAKYHTWGSHFVLGWADGIAPAGAWIGVTGHLDPEAVLIAFAVATWISGFDVMYSCADYTFDGEYRVHSAPRKFGIAGALRLAKGLHLLTAGALLGLGLWLGLGIFYYIGWTIAVALLLYENSLLKADDLSRLNLAFFNVNRNISLVLLTFTVLDVVA